MANTNRKNTLDQAGEYTLDRCEIVSYKNAENNKPRTVDIKLITGSIELVENIYQSSMIGKIQVFDSQDIRTILPITGFEKLNLKFQTPGQTGVDHTEENGRQFHIYKIESVSQDTGGQRTQGYDIFFTSKEHYFNLMTKVSKAYSGPIEDAIEDILRNKKFLNSNRALVFEPTKTNAKYVIPSLRPFEAIKYLCTQAVSQKYNNAGYCFYETPGGYFFRSLESMYALNGTSGRPHKFDYYYQMTNLGKEVNKDMHNVKSYTINNPINVLQNMDKGMFANRLVVHDAFNKTIKTHDFDYYNSFGDYFHVETQGGNKTFVKQLIPFTKFDDTDKDISQFPQGRTSVVTETSKVHNDYEFVPTKDTLPISLSQKQSLHNNIIDLIVPGNSLLCAGDIISFHLPLLRPVGDGEKQQENPQHSGRYLITSIKHNINAEMGQYEMSLKCSKDAVREGYMAERDTYQITKEDKIAYDIYEEDQRILSTMKVNPLDYT